MKKYRFLLLNILLFFVIALAALYSVFLFALPAVLSSSYAQNKICRFVYSKSGLSVDADNFKVKTYPNLIVSVSADKLVINDKENIELLTAKNSLVNYDLKKFAIKNLVIDYIFINETGFKNIAAKNKNKKPSSYRVKQIPEADIKRAEIWVDKNGLDSVFVMFSDINIINQPDGVTYCSFEAEILSTLIKNLISIGKTGYLYIKDNALYANKLQILAGMSSVEINGKLLDDDKKSDFTLKGFDIPVENAVASLLYFQKLKEPGKKFIENFYDFSGLLDVDVYSKDDGFYGKFTAKKLAAKTVLFDVPVYFDSVVFNLNQGQLSASAYGLLGGGKVFTSFDIFNIATPNQEVKGSVYSKLSNAVVHKYIPEMSVDGFADASVSYSVKNKKIYIDYLLKLKEGSDLHYKDAYLGLKDKNRRLLVNTLKYKDKLFINHYDYSLQAGNIIDNIILGKGLFVKRDGHLRPDYITVKTKDYAPVSVTGSFGRYVKEGFFNGNLKYDFIKKRLTGIFSIKDTHYKDFFVKNANVVADADMMNIKANGEYDGSAFNCNLSAINNFTNKIQISNMYLFLDEFIIKKHNHSTKGSVSVSDIAEQAQEKDISINKWTIKLNKIKRGRIALTDILVTGSVKDNIFSFSVPHINFADGLLKADGLYNLKDHSAELIFAAKNIDSNTAADVIFNLPGQIMGRADATLHAQTKHGLDEVKAFASFSIKKGYLPKIGSTKFIIKKSRMKQPLKLKLSDIVNIDIKNMKALSSDINGNFYFDNTNIKNVEITSSQKYLAMLIEGDYNMDSQSGNLNVLGKYNNKQISRVKIFFVPLSLLVRFVFRPEESMHIYKDKLKCVPDIQALPEEESSFRVKINGNLNKNDLKVELKSIK